MAVLAGFVALGLSLDMLENAADIIERRGVAGLGEYKQRLRTDPEVQTLEDGLALVFLETQLEEFAASLDDEQKLLNALRRTWEKMTPAGREAALGLPLGERARAIVERAVAGEEAGEPGSESSAAAEDCAHRWVLPSPGPDGMTGTCSRCGATRHFASEPDAVARKQIRRTKR